MIYLGYGEARFQNPEMHWLDLPVDPDAEEEEPTPERKPICSFAKKQTLLVHYVPKELIEHRLTGPHKIPIPHRILEFPVSGDEHSTSGAFFDGQVVGYILRRNPEFEHKFYNWAIER